MHLLTSLNAFYYIRHLPININIVITLSFYLYYHSYDCQLFNTPEAKIIFRHVHERATPTIIIEILNMSREVDV